MKNTSKIYDAIAPMYREYSKKRSKYLKAIDKLVIDNIPDDAASLLDVGAGDGIRGMLIAKEKKINYVVLSDLSEEMVKKCIKLSPSEIWHTYAENLPHSDKKFDVILCLWNVFGHIENREKRILALTKMAKLLSKNGEIFLDVNNRHNVTSYGWVRCSYRRIIDFIWPNEQRGDAIFNWTIGNRVIESKGHLFTPQEINSIISICNLKIVKKFSVNYTNGLISKSDIKGQLFFILKMADKKY